MPSRLYKPKIVLESTKTATAASAVAWSSVLPRYRRQKCLQARRKKMLANLSLAPFTSWQQLSMALDASARDFKTLMRMARYSLSLAFSLVINSITFNYLLPTRIAECVRFEASSQLLSFIGRTDFLKNLTKSGATTSKKISFSLRNYLPSFWPADYLFLCLITRCLALHLA